jgi:hypothetical protein
MSIGGRFGHHAGLDDVTAGVGVGVWPAVEAGLPR